MIRIDRLVEVCARKALAYRVNGRVELICRVMASGALRDCDVIDESPAGFEFGDAAVKMADLFQMRPMTRNGLAVSGAQVEIPINFSVVP